jgi:sugar/nucleoside kinase (ribokinase family)
VTQGTGDRCVVSRNASGRALSPSPDVEALVDGAADEAQAVLIDGHHPALAIAAARRARDRGTLCILDGGSWKPVTADLLSYTDIAICSADFRPPDLDATEQAAPDDVLGYLLDHGISWAVVTSGPRPVRWASRAHGIQPDVLVPPVEVADTLGAGDIFHGAFTHAIVASQVVSEHEVRAALRFAARVAAFSCQAFGPRAWMTGWP